MSLFQAVVLCLFNDTERYTYSELAQLSGIEEKELKRTLQSLACGKVRPLLKEPAGKDVAASDVFRFNADFSEKLYRIRINTIQLKETEEENKKTNEQVGGSVKCDLLACQCSGFWRAWSGSLH